MNHSEVAKRYVEYCLGLTSKDTGNGARCSYAGHKFYSYSTVVAIYYPEYQTLAMTIERYSNSTSKHKAKVRGAADNLHLRVVAVEDIHNPMALRNVRWYAEKAKENLEEALRARIYTSLVWYVDTVESAKNYCEAVGLHFNPDEFSPRALLADQPKLLQKYVVRRLDGTYQGVNA